jgi:hypothetical protein
MPTSCRFAPSIRRQHSAGITLKSEPRQVACQTGYSEVPGDELHLTVHIGAWRRRLRSRPAGGKWPRLVDRTDTTTLVTCTHGAA